MISALFIVNDFSFEFLGIMSLSSVLKKAGHNVEVVIADYNQVKRRLKNNNFRIVAYSADSVHIKNYLALNQKIKEEFRVISIFGGPHPTIFPEMIYEPGVDGICIGEGEYALLELVNHLSENKPINNIANWWIKENGKVFRNPPRPLIKNLDELPFADRKLFPDLHSIAVITSRGCPYGCSFCVEKGEYRRRNVDNVIEELEKVKLERQSRFVYFSDPTFDISLAWLMEFSQKYKKRIKLPFHCYVRADLVTPESIKCLSDAGCFSVGMGIETASDYLRNEILKKGISKEQIISAVNIIKKTRLKLKTHNMIGMPFGTFENDLETLKFNIGLRPDFADADLFCIFKDSGIYNLLIKDIKFKQLNTKPNCLYYKEYESNVNKRKIRNLYELFTFIVEFPALFVLVPLLSKLPLYRFYALLCLLSKGYCENFRIYGASLLGWRNFILGIWRYLKISLIIMSKGDLVKSTIPVSSWKNI